MALGTSIGGKKIIKSVGMDMVRLEKYQGFSADMASLLLQDFKRSIDFFDSHQPHGFTGKEAQMGNHSGR